jgi:hypothetical protein
MLLGSLVMVSHQVRPALVYEFSGKEYSYHESAFEEVLGQVSKADVPTLIISSGPTGSGKTGQQLEVKKANQISSWKKVLIDDYVENADAYKVPMFKFLVTNLIYPLGLSDAVRNKLEDAISKGKYVAIPAEYLTEQALPAASLNHFAMDLSPEAAKAVEDAYFAARKVGCANGWGCGNESDTDFFAACASGTPVVNEVTGKDYPSWFISECKKRFPGTAENFEVLVAGNLVQYCSTGGSVGLEARNSGRAADGIKNFLGNPVEWGAPRFPDLHNLPTTVGQYVDKMIEILACLKGGTFHQPEEWQKPCAGKIDKVILYQNDKKPIRKAFELTTASSAAEFATATSALTATKAANCPR